MNARGFTLLEVLVAVAIGSVILLALGKLYVSAIYWHRLDEPVSYMQRQGAIIVDELARHIRAASSNASNPMKCSPAGCDPIANQGPATCGVDPSLQITNPDPLPNGESAGDYCFRLDTTGGNQFIRARSGGGQSNMLREGGSLAALTVSPCPGVPMFSLANPDYPGCSPGCADPNRVDICFQLSTASTPSESMMFRASFTRRN